MDGREGLAQICGGTRWVGGWEGGRKWHRVAVALSAGGECCRSASCAVHGTLRMASCGGAAARSAAPHACAIKQPACNASMDGLPFLSLNDSCLLNPNELLSLNAWQSLI